MKLCELNNEQIKSLKCDYMMRLAEQGSFAEVVGRDYDSPSWEDLARADEIIPYDVIEREFEGVEFTDDDFPAVVTLDNRMIKQTIGNLTGYKMLILKRGLVGTLEKQLIESINQDIEWLENLQIKLDYD